MRQMISTVVIATAAAAVVAIAVGPVGPATAATECAAVPYGWSGSASIAPGDSFATGMVVPSEIGVELAVNAFDVSTIDPAPGAVAVRVGTNAVTTGATIAGGEIAVTNAGAAAVVLTRVELSLDRCYQVESAAAVPAAPVPGASALSAAPAAPVMPAVPEGGLPETGQASGVLIAWAIACVGAGMGMVALGRRRIGRRVG